MASAVIRVKRRITDEPFDRFVLNCKRQKINCNTTGDEIGANETVQEQNDDSAKTILKLAATVSADDDIGVHLNRLRKCDAEEIVRKVHKPTKVINRLREQFKDDAQNARFKVVNCFRSLETESIDDAPNESGDASGRNVTVVDVIKEETASKVNDVPDTTTSAASAADLEPSSSADKFVYDLYLVQSGEQPTEIDINHYTIRPFDDLVYQANDETMNESDFDSEDSNDEANWRNDYPDTDDDASIGEEDMRRAIEDMHFSSENESSDEEDYNYGEEPVVHFMAEEEEEGVENEYNYFKKHGHIRNHAAFYRSKRQNRQNFGAFNGDNEDDDDDCGSDIDGDLSSRSSTSSVSPLASCDEISD